MTTTELPAAAAGELTIGGDLRVRRMGYGAMQLAGPGVWGPPADPGAAIALLRRAVELGVNHIDTSDYYGPHVVNELIAEALHPYPEDLVIVTKVGARRTPDQGWPAALSPDELRRAVHDNLGRLRLDRLDVVNLRIVAEGGGLSPSDSIATQVQALAELREQGLLRHIGLSNVSVEQVEQARSITPIACVQNEYNVLRRRDDALVDTCAREGIAFMPFFPLGSFTLQHDSATGADTKVPQSSPLRDDAVDDIARRHGATAHQVALAWLLARSPAIACIPGTSSIAHLEQNIAAAAIRLTAADQHDLATAPARG
ncbi:oxidoreductase [Actinokineospora sp. NBRC 105648]|uniref:oxidoreductase n=1 Tax=Actinokineospora sp. NBRC 105648 TaxID=3032206 RepID=UPI00249FE5E1|nr:oxidoreductase [Actinokineospora sp. NBRC 105648]GLZ36591.1 oxidoreductase [Actinokineospora sp. NBRC 105648]